MLVSFSVENFKSIKEKQTIYMDIAKKYSSNNKKAILKDNIIEINDINEYNYLLKSACIYGANASGKSKFIESFAVFKTFFDSEWRELNDKITVFSPFLFDNKYLKNKPTFFEIEFILNENNINNLYKYSFSFNYNGIISEKLEKNNDILYNIVDINNNIYTFSKLFNANYSEILVKIKNKKYVNLFLREFVNEGNSDFLNNIFTFLKTKLFIINSNCSINYTIDKMDNDIFKKNILSLLKKSNDTIEDIHKEEFKDIPDSLLSFIKSTNKIVCRHKNGILKLTEESDGTILMFHLAGYILEVLYNGGILFFDELDKSLHPDLLIYIVRLFHNPSVNIGNGQIIFTVHNDILLEKELKLFRRDQIYFITKDSTEASRLYSLCEFNNVRIRDNIVDLYRQICFGARPILIDFFWEK